MQPTVQIKDLSTEQLYKAQVDAYRIRDNAQEQFQKAVSAINALQKEIDGRNKKESDSNADKPKDS